MAYTSLYRKYRPTTFDGVIGQDHIVRTLRNQILSDSVGHAYLFTGTRGTGKTSVAKIFARAVNCEQPVNASPCGECDTCLELALSGNFDVLEIDAASNNSVDQIRELTDKIGFAPTIGKYKVYIVDEVHMLTKSAYNALLKTLEEPPSHVIFILATTEVHQIPATILSRCLRFDFRLVPSEKIAALIKGIFEDMNIAYEPTAVDVIANAGQGSVRDALSIADMCVSYSAGNVTYLSVLEVLGASDPNKLAILADYVASGDLENALAVVSDMCRLGKSMPILASDLAEFFRNMLYVRYCKNAKEMLCVPDTTYALLEAAAAKHSPAVCLRIMKAMSALEGEFRYSTQHRILFEGALVAAATGGDSNEKIRELEGRIAALDKKLQTLPKSGFSPAPAKSDAKQVWRKVASELEKRGYKITALSALEADAEIVDGRFEVCTPTKVTFELLTEKQNRDVINEIFATLSRLPLVIKEEKRYDDDKALPFLKEMFGDKLEIK